MAERASWSSKSRRTENASSANQALAANTNFHSCQRIHVLCITEAEHALAFCRAEKAGARCVQWTSNGWHTTTGGQEMGFGTAEASNRAF
jgi:hypothetical protein